MKIAVVLREVEEAESELAAELRAVGERHATDHDVFHLTRLMHGWVDARLHRLSTHADRYGTDLDPERAEEERRPGVVDRLREKGADLVGRRPEPGLLLLRDMRDLHLAAARVSLAWTVLGQGAQAVQDTELLATVTACHPEAIRTMKWTVQKVKEASPQVLAS
ncbi:MAG: hypothetical protein AB7G37_02240 [Solirubrobacteraceae bacterium]